MSMTAVPISMRRVRAPIAASSGNGDATKIDDFWEASAHAAQRR
jgi:hypothetical protein